MAYDIPDKIRYREKILLNLDLRQAVYLIGFVILAALAYTLPILEAIKLIFSLLLVLTGVGFAFFELDKKILARAKYLKNFREGGALDKRIRKFVGVKRIENNTIYLDNGELRATILVKPVNFQLMDETRQKSIILNYRDFLNQLSHSIQIIVRTVNVGLADYFGNHEAKILNTNNAELIALYNDFRNYEEKFLKENFVKERLYYIVIPLERNPQGNKQKDAALIELGERVKIIQSKLADCNLITYRLSTNELISLFTSYFEGYVEVNEDYLWRITVCKSFFKGDKNG